MLYVIDTAHIEDIKKCVEIYPVAGVTTNPTIVSKEHTDFAPLLKNIRDIIGPDKMLHVQTTATTCEGIVKEALALQSYVGGDFYIKIPISEEGLKATKELKKLGVKVTMTAIFTQQQALISALAGADFVAPYVNRLDNIVADGNRVVEEIVEIYKRFDIQTKVLAASFKNVEQIHKAALAGSHAVTISPDLFEKLIYHPLTDIAIEGFTRDWESVYGGAKVLDLLK